MNISRAAVLLSHRHATRDGDDLTIWILLIGDIQDADPIAMWQRQVGNSIPTGSLISSAQRIEGHPGLGWAPFSPSALQRVDKHNAGANVYPAFDGLETSNGAITPEGLRAKWLTYIFPVGTASSIHGEPQQSAVPGPCVDIAARYLRDCELGVLLQCMPCNGRRIIPVPYRASLNWLIAVCGSRHGVTWEWKGIYEWDSSIALPPFSIKEILMI